MKITKRIIALLLSLAVIFTCVAPTFAATLPEGITDSDIKTAIPKLQKITDSLLSQNEETADLSKTVYGMLFSDDTLNSIFSGVYSALTENESTFNTLGIDISLSAVAEALSDFPDVSNYLLSQSSWEKALSRELTCKWKVTNKKGFSNALVSMFAPFRSLLYTLLCGGTYKVNAIIYVDGANGYQNAIVPILKALDCPDIMSQNEFSAAAADSKYSQVRNICEMLYASIDSILESPVDKLCTVLPCISYFIKNDGLKTSMETLIAPMKIRVAVFSLSGLDNILEKTGLLSDSANLTAMFEDMDLSELTGMDIDLTIPEINLDSLAACCTYADGNYTVDKSGAFCEILHWILTLVRQNKTKILSLTGMEVTSDATAVLDGFLAKSDDEIIQLLFSLLNFNADDIILEYSWSYPSYTPGSITYTPNLTTEEYKVVLEEIDGTLNEFMSEFGDASLSDTLAETVYSSKTVTALVKGVYGALYSDETASLFSLLGLDASPSGIADVISGSYPGAANAFRRASSWDRVGESFSWGFTPGSREGFEKALIAAFRPLLPFLELLLSEGEITLLDAITIKGSNGYNTAVIPLLEALGCRDVKTYSQFKSVTGTEALKYLLDPILNLIDTLIEEPVETICRRLPNIVYFVNSGGIKQCIDNLLYPVNVLLEKFGMSDIMPDSFSNLGDIDVSSLMKSLTDSGTLSITLPEPDLNLLASLGTAEQYDSKRTYNGLFTSYTYIDADAPAVLVTVLRYVIDALALPENSDVLSGFMSSDAMADNQMMAMYAGNITAQLESMTTDEIIEWLYNLLFRETPKKEITNEVEVIPTIIYEPKPDHTLRNRILLILAVVGIPTLLVVYISKTDFNEKKERRQRKKLKKQAAAKKKKTRVTAAKPLRAGNGAVSTEKTLYKTPVNAPYNNSRLSLDTPLHSSAVSAPEEQSASRTEENRTPGLTFIPVQKPQILTEKASAGDYGLMPEKNEKGRKQLKTEIRTEKAVKKAIRDAKKADKYYEQALKDSKKHR